MLRMQPFEVHLPTTVAEAARLRAELPESLFVAGGTDLLPNMKHGLFTPKHLVSLSHIDGFTGVTHGEDGSLRIGAGTTLDTLAADESLPAGLSKAAGLVAGPQHRKMGTLGGNVMLDTRCLFYNQSEQWRTALGYCLKAEGTLCHVIGSKKKCVAAHSADTVPVLIALDARVEVLDAGGVSEVSMRELYQQEGRKAVGLDEKALITAILVPPRPEGHVSTYRKVRTRAAIDFPQLGLGLSGAIVDGVVTELFAVASALMPQPKVLKGMDEAVGHALDDAMIEHLAERCYKQVRPQRSLHGDPDWRRHMARVEMRRGLEELVAQAR
ncbi:MAG: 4-hydroxybenzoyl-CoA reductase subunit beta [Deltaproteobacteria bacterium]|nr:MAG: 4-hydroxybenzoyl-CoA reductase subunit beta [Deltaproteobacteria bacterium]